MQNLRPRSSREHRGNISTHRKMEVLDAAKAGSGGRMSRVCFPLLSLKCFKKKIQIKWLQMFTARQNLYHIAQHNTIQYDTVWYNEIRRCTIQYGMIRCDMIQYNAMRHDTIQSGMIQYGILCNHTIRHDTVRYDTTWDDMIQYRAATISFK